jgi:hypothetical protein
MSTQNNNFAALKLAPFAELVRPEGGPFLFRKEPSDYYIDSSVIPVTVKTYESPENKVHEFQAVTDMNIRSQVDYLETQFVRNLMKASEKLTTYSDSRDELSIREYVEKLNSPGMIYMSPVVAELFAKNLKVEPERLSSFFKVICDLELIIEERVSLNSQGEPEFILGNTVILANDLCFVTVCDGDKLFNQVYEDGKVKTVATYSIEVMNPEYGLRIEVQM